MKYKINTIDEVYRKVEHIVIFNDDGTTKSFPKDGDNPEYVNFKEHINEYEKVVE